MRGRTQSPCAWESAPLPSRCNGHAYTPDGTHHRMTSNGTTPADWDVVIVGAGPAGMAAALYTGRAKLKTLLLDRAGHGRRPAHEHRADRGLPGDQEHHRCATWRRPSRSRSASSASRSPTAKSSASRRAAIGASSRSTTARNTSAKTVIVSTGGMPRKLGVPGEAEFAGGGVSYCAICDGAFFKNQVLAVIGGGDSAVEEATFLTRYAEKVYIIHRRDEWRAQKLLQERALANPKIVPIWNSALEEIGGQDKVEWLRLRDVEDRRGAADRRRRRVHLRRLHAQQPDLRRRVSEGRPGLSHHRRQDGDARARACTWPATCAASTCARSRTPSATRRPPRSPRRATSKSSTPPAAPTRPKRSSACWSTRRRCARADRLMARRSNTSRWRASRTCRRARCWRCAPASAGMRWPTSTASLHAVDNNCPHNGGPLSKGTLVGRELMCPGTAGAGT